MFVWGIIGYIAGIFSKQLHNDKYFLYGYSIVCGIGYVKIASKPLNSLLFNQ